MVRTTINHNYWSYKPTILGASDCNYSRPDEQLVGGIPTPLKNMKVMWDDYSQYMEK